MGSFLLTNMYSGKSRYGNPLKVNDSQIRGCYIGLLWLARYLIVHYVCFAKADDLSEEMSQNKKLKS